MTTVVHAALTAIVLGAILLPVVVAVAAAIGWARRRVS
jgi:hypothetical protein